MALNDPPSPQGESSVGYVTDRILRFVQLRARGFVRASFSSEFARQAVLGRLRGHELLCFDYTLVANDGEPDVALRIDQWVRTVESHESPLDVVSLVLTASPGAQQAFARACGRLNLYRETIGGWNATFLVWLPESWVSSFVDTIPDFASWVMLRLELGEVDPPPMVGAGESVASGITLLPGEARRIAAANIARAEATEGSASLTAAAVAVKALNDAGLIAEARDAALKLLPFYRSLSTESVLELRNRASLYASAGQWPSARADLEKAWNALRGHSSPAESEMAEVSNDLAAILETLGDYTGAEPLYAQALETRQRALGAEHPDTLSSVNNLARLYAKLGRYGEAEPLYARALAVRERVLGAEHPDTLTSVSNLAVLYENQGRYGEAELLYARTLAVRERVLGPEHPDTLTSVNNLAVLYENQGRYGEAEPLYARTLAALERVFGAEHPDTLTSVNNLAGLYARLGRYGEAELLYARALAALERVLGAEHPDTLTSVSNLAVLYKNQGRNEEAEPLFARALAARERVLGAEHPDTLTSVNNLAGLYASQGRYEEAEPLFARALAARERVLGAEHPHTLISVNNLADLYERQRRYGEAEPLYARALAGLERTLGPNHPYTQIVRNNLASLQTILPANLGNDRENQSSA